MSCITENTIVIRPEAEPTLLVDLDKVAKEFRISGVKQAFKNDNYIAYVFDCNGDQSWEIVDSGTLNLDFSKDVIGTETMYPEGDRWTQLFDKNGGHDCDKRLAEIMKKFLTKAEALIFARATEYNY